MHKVHALRSNVPCLPTWAALLLLHGIGNIVAASSGNSSRPTLRIGHLHAHPMLYVILDFMMEKFSHAENRTILPDYDVIVEPLFFDGKAIKAGSRVVEAIQSPDAFHAFVGPWQRGGCTETVDLAATARVLQVTICENAEFTLQPERYPYIFRAFPGDVGAINFWTFLAASNHWFTVVSAWGEGANLDASHFFAQRYGITNFGILADGGVNAPAWQREAWQGNVISGIRQSRSRVVLTLLPTTAEMYELACRVHRSRIKGLQYFANGAYQPFWWQQAFDSRFGDCSVDEITEAVGGYVSTLHLIRAPGVTFTNTAVPLLDGNDTSREPLTCMPGITAWEFYNDGELIQRGRTSGYVNDLASTRLFVGVAGPLTDMLCSLLLGFHDLLYNKKADLANVERRDDSTFQELLHSVGEVNYFSPTGRFRYLPGTKEREVIYYYVNQHGLRGDQSWWSYAVTYPGGIASIPEVTPLNESIPLVWKDGSTGIGPNPEVGQFENCSKFKAEFVWDHCEACAPGRAYDVLLDSCRTCPSGDYQEDSGATFCNAALQGEFINDTQQPTRALPCPRGHECPQIGTVHPQQCPRGAFSAEEGMAECRLCPKGRFQDEVGATTCKNCSEVLKRSTTENIASTLAMSCICPEGTYRPAVAEGEETECVACPEGLQCPEGSDMRNLPGSSISEGAGFYPLVEEGYMTLPEAPLKVYSCRLSVHCPGGPPATCADFRDTSSVACGRCREDSYPSSEKCRPCGDTSVLPIILAGVACAFLVSVATLAMNSDLRSTPQTIFTIVAISSLLFTSLQALGVFHQLDIPWEEPAKTLIRLSALLTFDLDVLQLSCTMGSDPVKAFAFRQVVPALVLPVAALAIFCKHARRKFVGSQSRDSRWLHKLAAEVVNAVGALYSLFFISIVISALSPFLCYRHPSENGESVISAPSLLCFQSTEHSQMIVISVLSTALVPIPFLALCGFGILKYRRYVDGGVNSAGFLHAFRFLFIRYSPRCYYFQCILLQRSLFVCVIPAVLRGSTSTQVLFMCIVLSAYSICVTQLQAWRSQLCNLLDAAMNVMMSVVLTCGALFLDDRPNLHYLAALTTFAFLLPVILGLLGALVMLKRHLVPSPVYNFFICHHKAHAAAQARVLKILLHSKRKGMDIFIDSDNLTELDTLFDTVKSRVRTLVVYLTADTLRRPWCAGEITSAVWAGLHIVRLHTPSFPGLEEEQLKKPASYVDSTGCNLREYGIQWEHVSEAFAQLLSDSTEHIELSQTALGTRRFALAASALLKQRPHDDESRVHSLPSQVKVVISTDRASDEASAAAAVLVACISEAAFKLYKDRVYILADYEHDVEAVAQVMLQAMAVVVLLSGGCLQMEEFVRVIFELQFRLGGVAGPMMSSTGRAAKTPSATTVATAAAASPAIVPMNTPDFVFPGDSYFAGIRKRMPSLYRDYGEECSLKLLKMFFKHISILLPTHASQEALSIQSQEVLARMRYHARSKGAIGVVTDCSTPSSTSVSDFEDAADSAGAVKELDPSDVAQHEQDGSKKQSPLLAVLCSPDNDVPGEHDAVTGESLVLTSSIPLGGKMETCALMLV